MFKKKIIRVEFTDVDSGEMIGYDEQNLKSLPDSFEFSTVVEIDGEKWEVVRAEPEGKKKIKKAGTLQIDLRLVPIVEAEMEGGEVQENDGIEYIERTPNERVFQRASRPAIYPAFTGKRKDKNLLEMGTWEWRQIEFVSLHETTAIQPEFDEIKLVQGRFSRLEAGKLVYTRQHRRAGIKNPLAACALKDQAMQEEFFPFGIPYDGVTFMGADGLADGAFALKTAAGLCLYGLSSGGNINCIGLRPPNREQTGLLQADLKRLEQFMSSNQLCLVDWDRMAVTQPKIGEIQAFLHFYAEAPADLARAMEPLSEENEEKNAETAIDPKESDSPRLEEVQPVKGEGLPEIESDLIPDSGLPKKSMGIVAEPGNNPLPENIPTEKQELGSDLSELSDGLETELDEDMNPGIESLLPERATESEEVAEMEEVSQLLLNDEFLEDQPQENANEVETESKGVNEINEEE